MADAPKNPIPTPPPGQMPVISRKVFMRSSEEPPIFINSAEFTGMGMDVFMDLGVVPAESVNEAIKLYKEDPSKPVPVDFHISFRFGMSIQSAIVIHQRLSMLLQQSAIRAQEELAAPGKSPEKG